MLTTGGARCLRRAAQGIYTGKESESRRKGRALPAGTLLAVLLTLQAAGGLWGQESDRRWALRCAADLFDRPVLTHRSPGASVGNAGSAFALTGEYYLRDNWSLEAGYFRTDVSCGDASRLMEGLRTGARRYFLPPDFIVRPCLSAAAELNWGEHVQRRTFGGSGPGGQPDYTGTQHTVNPRLSLVPGVGAEIRLLSSVALTLDYGFHMGLASRTEVTVAYDGLPPQIMRDRGLFHSLSLGARVTFPFSFTSGDATGLLYVLKELLFNCLDRSAERDPHVRNRY
ncbi:MAG: hypothetical protein LBJ01_05235 [Tannerella sp.]|jgi:hypothetical protein|nr:hypothetical protein [Tannerella sp.]